MGMVVRLNIFLLNNNWIVFLSWHMVPEAAGVRATAGSCKNWWFYNVLY